MHSSQKRRWHIAIRAGVKTLASQRIRRDGGEADCRLDRLDINRDAVRSRIPLTGYTCVDGIDVETHFAADRDVAIENALGRGKAQ